MRKAETWQEQYRPFGKRLAGPFLLLFIMFYLAFHAVSGDHGALALFRETRKLQIINAELAEVKGKHDAIERKVHLLSDNSLDLDLLDEQVRRVLGMANKNEIVYFDDEKKAERN